MYSIRVLYTTRAVLLRLQRYVDRVKRASYSPSGLGTGGRPTGSAKEYIHLSHYVNGAIDIVFERRLWLGASKGYDYGPKLWVLKISKIGRRLSPQNQQKMFVISRKRRDGGPGYTLIYNPTSNERTAQYQTDTTTSTCATGRPTTIRQQYTGQIVILLLWEERECMD